MPLQTNPKASIFQPVSTIALFLIEMKNFLYCIKGTNRIHSQLCLARWIDLRVPFREVFGGGRCNLKEAVEKAGLSWQGRAHCGLDDARNTACLLALLMHRGFKFSITNSLTRDEPLMSNAPPEKPVFIAPRAQRQHQNPFCYCGVKSSKGIVRKPGPRQGSIFFGCGNWTAARGALCQYFQWASL